MLIYWDVLGFFFLIINIINSRDFMVHISHQLVYSNQHNYIHTWNTRVDEVE
jgi:hypothetical protein